MSIDKQIIKAIKKSELVTYRNLYADIAQLIDMVGTHREILTGSIDIYMTAVSNNLNEVMKKLTMLTDDQKKVIKKSSLNTDGAHFGI